MKLCSDSSACLNFQAEETFAHLEMCTKSNLGDWKENHPQNCGFVAHRFIPRRGTVIRSAAGVQWDGLSVSLLLLPLLGPVLIHSG